MSLWKGTLKDGRANLRGRRVSILLDGRWYRVTVVTHTQGDRWVVEGRLPPRYRHRPGLGRVVVSETDMEGL